MRVIIGTTFSFIFVVKVLEYRLLDLEAAMKVEAALLLQIWSMLMRRLTKSFGPSVRMRERLYSCMVHVRLFRSPLRSTDVNLHNAPCRGRGGQMLQTMTTTRLHE